MAIALIVLLTLAAAIGGILPQSPTTANAYEIYRSYGPFWYRLIARLSLDDVFHSGWFFILTGAFALNLIACSGRRLRQTITTLLRQPRHAELCEGDPRVRHIDVDTSPEETTCIAEQILRRSGLRRIVRTDASQIVAQRWRWSVLAPDAVHLGILVILIGALLGVLRQEGTFTVNEWQIGKRLPRCGDALAEATDTCVQLPYGLRIEGFGVETYDDGARVKSYWAELSFLQDETVLDRGRISVNHPMTVRGFGFYPWRYGDDVQAARVRLQVFDPSLNAVTSELDLQIGETVAVPGTHLHLTALQFYRAFSLDQEGNPVDLGSISDGHPAVLIRIAGTDEDGDDVAYRDLALPFVVDTETQVKRTFILSGAAIPSFIELHYVRNPGYPVVWWGFVVLMVGLAGAFYFRPLQIRASISPAALALRIDGRGSTNRLDRIVERIRLHYEQEEDPCDVRRVVL